jgi:hypothetical protein
MFHADDVGQTIAQFQARIRELESAVAALEKERGSAAAS